MSSVSVRSLESRSELSLQSCYKKKIEIQVIISPISMLGTRNTLRFRLLEYLYVYNEISGGKNPSLYTKFSYTSYKHIPIS